LAVVGDGLLKTLFEAINLRRRQAREIRVPAQSCVDFILRRFGLEIRLT
jgi:hypothetical protein